MMPRLGLGRCGATITWTTLFESNAVKCKATECCTYKEACDRLPRAEAHAKALIAALRKIAPIPQGASILDVGAAQGRFLIGCARMGFDAVGVEPWDQAREIAAVLASEAGVHIGVLSGRAESLPFPDACFDLVHAGSVIEHVKDVRASFAEAFRVLKPGGVYWFFTASSMCPIQQEISGFPLFGWYPDALKRRIMLWAMNNRPRLVGMSKSPALNWFTPGKARRLLTEAGFVRIHDRWDLASPSGRAAQKALSIIRSNRLVRMLANIAVSGCAYAAVKK
jgi:ubiquinone/menaquinone biosynthesis C-methylase UbiE